MTTASDTALRAIVRNEATGYVDAVLELARRRKAGKVPTPLYREPNLVRLRYADSYADSVVDVEVDSLRNGDATTIRARLVSVAVGGTSDALVLKHPSTSNRRDQLVELARVVSIRYAPAGANLDAFYR